VKPIVFAALLAILPHPLIASEKPAPTVTSTFLHLWLPELGPFVPAGQFESHLAQAVAETRRGRFTTAEKPLAAATAAAVSPRERLLCLLAQQQHARRRFDLVTGGRLSDGETALADLESREDAKIEEAFALAETMTGKEHDDAVAAIKYAGMLQLVLDQIPAEHRATNAREMLDEPRAALRAQLDEIAGLFMEHQAAATNAGAISAPEAELLHRLLQAELARGHGDPTEAVKHLQAGLAAAPESARRYWLLRLGDALAAPASSPLLLGIDAIAADGLIALIEDRKLPPSLSPPDAASLDRAAAAYDAASSAAANDPPFLAAVQLRRAYLQLARGDVMKALDGFAAVRSGIQEADVVSWCAGAAVALMRTDRRLFRAVVNEADRENNGGFVIALVLVSRTWAAKFRFLNAKPEEAIELLEIMSDALVPLGRRAAVEPLLDLIGVYQEVDRYSGAIIAAREAHWIQSEHVCRLHALPQQSGPDGADPVDPEEENLLTTIIGSLASGLRTKALLEGDPKAAALADVLAAEYARREVIYSATSTTPVVEAQEAALKQPVIGRLATDAAALRGKPCADIAPQLAAIREEALAAGLIAFVWQFDINNMHCAPQNVKRDLEEVRRRGLTTEIEKRLAETSQGGLAGMVANASVEGAVRDALTALRLFGAAAPLADYGEEIQRLASLVKREPALHSYEKEVLRQFALFYWMAGEAASVVRVAGDFVADAGWDSESLEDKVHMLKLWLDAEVELCKHARTCAPERALLVRERLGFESRRWQWLQSGASQAERGSAELAALETSMAASPATNSSDFARLSVLRNQNSADSWMRREEPPTADSVKRTLAAVPRDVTVLMYSAAASRGILWRYRAGKLELITLSREGGALAERARELLTQLEVPLGGTWEPLAADLFDVLVRPAGPIPAGDRLVIVASGDVGRLPFEILGPAGGPRLYEGHPIIYTDHLGVPEKREPRGAPAAVIVGVNAEGLTAAESEAANVARVLSTTAILGSQATRSAVTAAIEHASWVHLATHAARVRDNPYDSHLTLAGGDHLRAWDLFRHAPAAEVIVLSACDGRAQARGLLDTGSLVESETSLMSFAFAGGARFVLASIWRATDQDTSDLMIAFYEALRSGADPPAALQQAKARRIAEAGELHPFYFANFVLTARNLAAVGGD
jgi:hypothetical protein